MKEAVRTSTVTIRRENLGGLPGLTERQVLNRLHKIADAERRKAEAEAEIKALRAEIVGDADALSIECPAYIVRWTPSTSSRIDSKRLERERPDIYAEYLKPVTSTRFTYKIR